jgi:hypothetical protein
MSGRVIQFGALAAAVMACLEESACSETSLATAISCDLAVVVDRELKLSIHHILQDFAELGWIEQPSS